MIDASRGNLAAAAYLDSLDEIAISIVTAHELIVGARNQADVNFIDGLIKAYRVEADLDSNITQCAYRLLQRHAKPDGLRTFDALIAATAIEKGLTLASRNRKHFRCVQGLDLEVPNY
jgi:predicted nucleic acid-binding protein